MQTKLPAIAQHALQQLVAALSLFLAVAGCQSVRTDAQPASPGLFATTYIASENSCRYLMLGKSQLPLDLYHGGICYEQGLGVQQSLEKAVDNYSMAARWGIPEAGQALKRLGRDIPEADLMARQKELEIDLNRQRAESLRNHLDEERLQLIREGRGYGYPGCFHSHCYRHCRHGWCY